MFFLTAQNWWMLLGIVAALTWICYSPANQKNRHRLLKNLPVADIKDGDWRQAILKMSTKYPDLPWILPTTPPRVILPNHVMDEIRFLPEDQVSLRKEVYAKMHGRYTDLGLDHPVGISAIKTDLTNNVGRMVPALQEETIHALNREFGTVGTKSWSKISLYDNLLQLSALVNGRMFVGLPLCRDKDWIEMTIKYTLDMVFGIRAVEAVPPVLRRYKAPFLPEIRNLAAYKKRATAMLKPHVDEAIKANKAAGGKKNKDNVKLNLITWMLNQMETPDYELLASEQIFAGKYSKLRQHLILLHIKLDVAFGAIHATSITVTNAMYDLAAYPQYVAELRAEIVEVLSSEPDHVLRKAAMPRLMKLDSFLRESQRMNPGNISRSPQDYPARTLD
jgi:hypothetical protein